MLRSRLISKPMAEPRAQIQNAEYVPDAGDTTRSAFVRGSMLFFSHKLTGAYALYAEHPATLDFRHSLKTNFAQTLLLLVPVPCRLECDCLYGVHTRYRETTSFGPVRRRKRRSNTI